MKTILAAVDGSKPSERAVRMAADLALRLGAQLTLVHVLEPMFIPTEVGGVVLAQIGEDRRKEAQRLLRDAETALKETGLTVHRVVMEGQVADGIAELASSQGFDMVVIGSRGRGAAARVLLGSVSDRLAHICERPILIVR